MNINSISDNFALYQTQVDSYVDRLNRKKYEGSSSEKLAKVEQDAKDLVKTIQDVIDRILPQMITENKSDDLNLAILQSMEKPYTELLNRQIDVIRQITELKPIINKGEIESSPPSPNNSNNQKNINEIIDINELQKKSLEFFLSLATVTHLSPKDMLEKMAKADTLSNDFEAVRSFFLIEEAREIASNIQGSKNILLSFSNQKDDSHLESDNKQSLLKTKASEENSQKKIKKPEVITNRGTIDNTSVNNVNNTNIDLELQRHIRDTIANNTRWLEIVDPEIEDYFNNLLQSVDFNTRAYNEALLAIIERRRNVPTENHIKAAEYINNQSISQDPEFTQEEKILENVYIGNYDSLRKLDPKQGDNPRNFTRVISVTRQDPKSSNEFFQAAIPQHIEDKRKVIQVDDDATAWRDLLNELSDVRQRINDARNTSENILIHCTQGESRSVTLVALYLIFTAGISAEEALTFIKIHRLATNPKPSLKNRLTQYQHSLGIK